LKQFHLHLVSDATGETLDAVAKAALVQFEGVHPIIHPWSTVRSLGQIERVLQEVKATSGIVIFTLVKTELRNALMDGCNAQQIPCVPVLEPIIGALGNFLGVESQHRPGLQHAMDEDYFGRLEAMKFTMEHDDGQLPEDLDLADIVLVGVSRTTKTPTSIYLANRGIRVANVPIVPDCPLPRQLGEVGDKCFVVGLTISPDRLVPVRRSRLLSLRQEDTEYVDPERVREEVTHARRLFSREDWPVIDVTRKSIEETAAAVINLRARRSESGGVSLAEMGESPNSGPDPDNA
jgi:[pyruvate, water dikinase]-phosphate phosphotransferase / [pyruvate, water dikinase] kinase